MTPSNVVSQLVRVAAARRCSLSVIVLLVAVEHEVEVLLLQVLDRHVEREAVLLRDGLEHAHVPGVRRGGARPGLRSRLLRSRGCWFGTTSAGSISIFTPRPVQSGQAPCGLLKLKLRGSISPTDDAVVRRRRSAPSTAARPRRRSACTADDARRRSPSFSAVSTESARRAWRRRGLRRRLLGDDQAVDDDLDVVALVLVEVDRPRRGRGRGRRRARARSRPCARPRRRAGARPCGRG